MPEVERRRYGGSALRQKRRTPQPVGRTPPPAERPPPASAPGPRAAANLSPWPRDAALLARSPSSLLPVAALADGYALILGSHPRILGSKWEPIAGLGVGKAIFLLGTVCVAAAARVHPVRAVAAGRTVAGGRTVAAAS